MKFLLLIGLVLGILWFFRRPARENGRSRPPAVKPSERMVECAHCGVYHLESESIQDGPRHYCCAEHRAARDGAD